MAAALSFSLGAVAQTESVSFTLTNDTPYELIALFISDTGSDSWEDDILGVEVIESGDAAEVTIDDGLSDCVYDLRADFSDGESIDLRGVDLCELDGGSLSVSE